MKRRKKNTNNVYNVHNQNEDIDGKTNMNYIWCRTHKKLTVDVQQWKRMAAEWFGIESNEEKKN